MTKKDMMVANRDPKREIRVVEAHLVHVLLSRVDYNPLHPEINSTVEKVMPYPVEEFQKMEKTNIGSHRWFRDAGFTSAKVIHDPADVDPELKKQIQEFWDSLLKPKVTPVEQMAAEIKSLKRKLNINRGGF